MSLQFSDPINKNGIVELIYANTGTDLIKYPIEEVTRDVNLAVDRLLSIAIPTSGNWQVDDSNHTKDPIITTNLVLGQRDYHFTVDEQSNLILDIYRVMIADVNEIFYDLDLVDQQTREQALGFVDGQNKTGKPTMYDKTANGIFLDAIPDYNSTGGLKIFYSREANYFLSADTGKKPGFDGRLHEYLALRPSYQYAYRKGLSVKNDLYNEMIKFEGDKTRRITGLIAEVYGQRRKDEVNIISGETINSI